MGGGGFALAFAKAIATTADLNLGHGQ